MSSLIFIAKLNLFDLLKKIVKKIFIPREVYNELVFKDAPEIATVDKELGGFVEIVDIDAEIKGELDHGEKAAISLCLKKKIKIFLSDDNKARKYALSRGLEVIGVIGIILELNRKKHIKKDEAEKLMIDLINHGHFMSPRLYSEVMQLIKDK